MPRLCGGADSLCPDLTSTVATVGGRVADGRQRRRRGAANGEGASTNQWHVLLATLGNGVGDNIAIAGQGDADAIRKMKRAASTMWATKAGIEQVTMTFDVQRLRAYAELRTWACRLTEPPSSEFLTGLREMAAEHGLTDTQIKFNPPNTNLRRSQWANTELPFSGEKTSLKTLRSIAKIVLSLSRRESIAIDKLTECQQLNSYAAWAMSDMADDKNLDIAATMWIPLKTLGSAADSSAYVYGCIVLYTLLASHDVCVHT